MHTTMHKKFLMIEIPKVDAYADEKGFLHLWCDHCQRWHNHGKFEGHRVKHCNCIGSPYEQSSYNLVCVGKWTKEIRKQYREKNSVLCPECRSRLSPKPPIHCPKCGWKRKTRLVKKTVMKESENEYQGTNIQRD